VKTDASVVPERNERQARLSPGTLPPTQALVAGRHLHLEQIVADRTRDARQELLTFRRRRRRSESSIEDRIRGMDAEFGEMLDTSPEERRRYYALITRLTPAERARKVAGLGRALRDLIRAEIRRTDPDASPLDVELALVARLYGDAAARRLAPFLAARG
jgi:hypothetical protein